MLRFDCKNREKELKTLLNRFLKPKQRTRQAVVMAQDYIAEHHFMRVRDNESMPHLSHSTAAYESVTSVYNQQELRQKDEGIQKCI